MITRPESVPVIQIVSAEEDSRQAWPVALKQVSAASCPTEVLAEFASARVILSVPPSEYWDWVVALSRRRRYFALSRWHDESWYDLQLLAQLLARRRPSPVLLGTWRYLPAVLGLQEVLTAGILGQNVRLELHQPATDMPQKQLLAADVMTFLSGGVPTKLALNIESDDNSLQVIAVGSVGTAVASGSVEGSGGGTLLIRQNSLERRRCLPSGNPHLLESLAFVRAAPDECCLPKVNELVNKAKKPR